MHHECLIEHDIILIHCLYSITFRLYLKKGKGRCLQYEINITIDYSKNFSKPIMFSFFVPC